MRNIFITVATIFVALSVVGYYEYLNSQERSDLIVGLNRNLFQISRYYETKKIYTSTDVDGTQENYHESVDQLGTDFIVGISNKQIAPSKFGLIDYKYDAFLLILSMKAFVEEKEYSIAGYDIYDKDQKPVPESEIPMGKFSFNEKGDIYKIELPKGVSAQVHSSIVELIEKMVPKLTKEEYLKEGSKYSFQNNVGELNLIEKEEMYDFVEPKIGVMLRGSKAESVTNRKVEIASGKITEVSTQGTIEVKRKVGVIRRKKDDKVPPYMDVNFNSIKMFVDSKITLIETEEKGLKTISSLSNLVEESVLLDASEFNFSQIRPEEAEETEGQVEEVEPEDNILKGADFKANISKSITLGSGNLLDTQISISQVFEVNVAGKKISTYLKLKAGSSNFELFKVSCAYKTSGSGGTHPNKSNSNAPLFKAVFPVFGIPCSFTVKVTHSFGVGLDYGLSGNNVFAEGSINGSVKVRAELGPDCGIVRAGGCVTGTIVSGKAYAKATAGSSTKVVLGYVLQSCEVRAGIYGEVCGISHTWDTTVFQGFKTSNEWTVYG